MANNNRYYKFLLRTEEIEEFIEKYNLPYGDESYFVDGKLTNKYLTDEELNDFDFKTRYILSLYGMNQIVIDTDEDGKDDLRQIGTYKYILSGAGFNSIINKSKFVGNWEKKSIKDTLNIKEYEKEKGFTWQRKKQINETLYYLWEGEYTFAENIVIFSLSKKGNKIIKLDDLSSFLEKDNKEKNKILFENNENLKSNKINFYGYMMGPIKDSHNNLHIYSAFQDDTKSDFTSFYVNDTINVNIENKIKPGGRGQLKYGIIDIKDKDYTIYYDIGKSDSDDRKSTLTTAHHDIESSEGGEIEDSYDDDRFGSAGGNVIKNSFDFYEKHEAKNGHLLLEFFGIGLKSSKKYLNIIVDDDIEISDSNIKYVDANDKIEYYKNPDDLEKPYYQMSNKNKFYFTVKRYKEINLEESYIYDSDDPEKKYRINNQEEKGKYSLGKIKSFSMKCLDNCKIILSFDVPFPAKNEYTLELKTKPRDFYLAICRDDNIDRIYFTINGKDKEYKIEDDNKINKNYSFNAGNEINVKIIYKDEYSSLMNVLTTHYIKTFIDPTFTTLNSSSNKIQEFSFKMPEKDVFLPLFTENYYTLTVYRKEKSDHISTVNGVDLPFVKKYFWNDLVTLEVEFDDFENDNKQQFYCIDKNFMISQLADIKVRRRDHTDYDETNKKYSDFNPQWEYLNPDGYGVKGGFTQNFQKVEFNMPYNDLTLYLGESSILRNLTIKRDNYQYLVGDNNGVEIEDHRKKYIEKCRINDTDYDLIPDNSIFVFVYGEEIDIYVKFLDTGKKLDLNHLYGQIIPENRGEHGEFIPENLNSEKYLWQYFQIKMPLVDTTLFLKWEERFFSFVVDYFRLLSYTTYKITDKNDSISQGIFDGSLELHYGDKLEIIFNLDELVTANDDRSYYKIDKEKGGPPLISVDPYFKYIKEPSQILISSNIIDKNIFINLEFEYPLDFDKLVEDYDFGTIQLTKGKYLIIIKGASGGMGGMSVLFPTAGEKGCGYHSIVEIDNIVELKYRIGKNGNKGSDGESVSNFDSNSGVPVFGGGSSNLSIGKIAGNGGGGGGSSLLYFSSEVKLAEDPNNKIKAVFCNGGAGGWGGLGQITFANSSSGGLFHGGSSSIIILQYMPGHGGAGGNSNSNPNQTGKGENGKLPVYVLPRLVLWDGGSNAVWCYDNYDDDKTNSIFNNNTRGGDGHSYYNFIERQKTQNNDEIKVIEDNNNFDLYSIEDKIDDYDNFEKLLNLDTGYFFIKRIE
jgi:hypothetical protein